jgi:hypothetical protein
MKKHIAHDEGYRYVRTDDELVNLSDFDLAVTLLSKGFAMNMIRDDGYGKKIFVFKHERNIDDVINGYWSNQIDVKPLDFVNNRKNLKSRIFGMRT